MEQSYQLTAKQTTAPVQQSNCPPAVPLASRYGCKNHILLPGDNCITVKFDAHLLPSGTPHITIYYMWDKAQNRDITPEIIGTSTYTRYYLSSLSLASTLLNEMMEG